MRDVTYPLLIVKQVYAGRGQLGRRRHLSSDGSDDEEHVTRQHHRKLIRQIQAWPREAPGQPIDSVLANLNMIIKGLSTIGIPSGRLRRPQTVERVQEEYIQLLWRYLRSLTGGDAGAAGAKLADGLIDGVRAKEAYAMHKKLISAV